MEHAQTHLDYAITILGVVCDSRREFVEGAEAVGRYDLVAILQLADKRVENVDDAAELGEVGSVGTDTSASS